MRPNLTREFILTPLPLKAPQGTTYHTSTPKGEPVPTTSPVEAPLHGSSSEEASVPTVSPKEVSVSNSSPTGSTHAHCLPRGNTSASQTPQGSTQVFLEEVMPNGASVNPSHQSFLTKKKITLQNCNYINFTFNCMK